jgi:hypothetical protein
MLYFKLKKPNECPAYGDIRNWGQDRGRGYFTTDGQSYVFVSSTVVGLASRYYFLSECCWLKLAVLFLWGALSDERTGLQFAVKSLNVPSRAEPTNILYSSETPSTWRAGFPYLYPPRTGWPSYTPWHWFPFTPCLWVKMNRICGSEIESLCQPSERVYRQSTPGRADLFQSLTGITTCVRKLVTQAYLHWDFAPRGNRPGEVSSAPVSPATDVSLEDGHHCSYCGVRNCSFGIHELRISPTFRISYCIKPMKAAAGPDAWTVLIFSSPTSGMKLCARLICLCRPVYK